MDENSLLQLIQGEEWKDLEFKVASNEVPKSVYDTVSAFSNTNGGTIVFGIHKE
ncbi:MAG: ATP-binding protein [Candidatus Thermoplasmatota archaeon]|nr:ATP-binding protein [Candidatus Thermoplasmatota archaeon]